MHSPMNFAIVALLALSSVAAAVPGNAPYGYNTPAKPASVHTTKTCTPTTKFSTSIGKTVTSTCKPSTKFVTSEVTQTFTTTKTTKVPYTSVLTTAEVKSTMAPYSTVITTSKPRTTNTHVTSDYLTTSISCETISHTLTVTNQHTTVTPVTYYTTLTSTRSGSSRVVTTVPKTITKSGMTESLQTGTTCKTEKTSVSVSTCSWCTSTLPVTKIITSTGSQCSTVTAQGYY